MEELEKTARELILAITEKTLKSLKDKGLLKEPSKLQMLCSSPEMKSLIKKLSASKYDPCREFKEGDKVRVKREVLGRPVYIGEDAWEPLDPDEIWSVEEDELETGWVHIKTSCVHATVWHAMLELVTPVEELEQYVVRLATSDGVEEWHVEPRNNNLALVAVFGHRHPNAKAAAEAECKRLNEEYRKETK